MELQDILRQVSPLDKVAMTAARDRQAQLAKPPGSLGRLEDLSVQLAGITGQVHNKIEKKHLLVFAADNGVVAEGVSSAPQSVTLMQTVNLTRHKTGASVLAKHFGCAITVCDVGVNADITDPSVLNRKIAYGTQNIARGPAMTRQQAVQAILTGIDLGLSEAGREELKQLYYDIKNVRFITSGMKRTNETLRILFGDVPYEVEPRFREVDVGIFEMHSYEELKDTPLYQVWLTGDNESNVPPNGESGVQMKERVLMAFSEIREDVCIITHGGVIATIMQHLFPNENKNRYDWQPGNGKGFYIANDQYKAIP